MGGAAVSVCGSRRSDPQVWPWNVLWREQMPDKKILPMIAGFGMMVVLILIGMICMYG